MPGIGIGKVEIEEERVIRPNIGRSADVGEAGVLDSVTRADHQFGCSLVGEADARSKIVKRRVRKTGHNAIREIDSVFRQRRGEG